MAPVAAIALLVVAQAAAPTAPAGKPAPLVVLTATGGIRDGMPIVEPATDAAVYDRALSRGYAARVVRLYGLVQRLQRPGEAPQPAYLVLTDNQGGFPRRGVVLDGRVERDLRYIDLHRRSTVSGRYGAMDQIFPHELLHTIVEILAGPTPEGGANQVHAIGVTTDRITAFNEGFAEHGQLMAIEDDDALPGTHALMSDEAGYRATLARFDEYRRARTARWRVAPRANMTFPFWFSGAEQVLRYHGVRDNLFAIAPDVPLPSGPSYDAYLLDNVLPGRSGGRPLKPARLIAREGVLSALFYRLVTSTPLRQRYRPDAFYTPFGTTRTALDPLDNVYLKMFAAIREGGYDAGAVVRAWMRLFPEDAADVENVVRSVLLGQPLPDAPALWLTNPGFTTGTSLFDQFRARPRAHAFDLNACSGVDLMTVPGMTPEAALTIVARSPYGDVEDLVQRAAPPAAAATSLRALVSDTARRRAADAEDSVSLSIRAILEPYLWRALEVIAVAALAAAILHRYARRLRWRRAILNGIAGALCGAIVAWSVDPGTGLIALAVPILLFGVPAALWRGLRTRSLREARTALVVWSLAALIPAALTTAL